MQSHNEMWILKNSSELLQKMTSFYNPKTTSNQTFDFSTLYTSIPHQKLKDRMHMLVNQTFPYKNGSRGYKYLVIDGDRTFFTNKETSAGKKYDETLICQMIDFLVDNIYINIGNHLFRQCIGICMGTNCAPLLAKLFLYSYDVEILRSMKKSNKKLAKAFNLTSRCILTTSSVSITQGLNKSSKISTQRSLWSQRHQSREMLRHIWIY